MNVENGYASKATAGTALGLSIGALGAQALSGNMNGLLGGIFGNNCNNGCGCSENMPINRYEQGLQQQLAAKDARIGLLESTIYTDSKIADVYERLNRKIDANKDEQTAINTQQAVYNGTNTATIGCIMGQVGELLALTKRVVPNGSICPGWGDVTVSVTPAATTTPATGA